MKKLMFKILMISGLMICLTGSPLPVNGQCAMCKKSAETANSREDTAIASTLNQGVLYLLALPYLAAGVIGIVWYRNNKIQNA